MRLWYYIGSVYFTILLLILTAIAVTFGTVVESITDSHLYAAELSYQHPYFIILLGLFFVNILVSTLRRGPFRKSHIPFLITHLALLMMFSGVIVKAIWGVQGVMRIKEGSSSETVFFPHTHGIAVDDEVIPLSEKMKVGDLEVTLKAFAPHGKQIFQYFVKPGYADFSQIGPVPLGKIMQIKLHKDSDTIWDLVAFESDKINQKALELYIDRTQVQFKNKSVFLKDLINEGISVPTGQIRAHIELDEILIHHEGLRGYPTQTNSISVETLDQTNDALFGNLYRYKLKTEPLIVAIKDDEANQSLFAFDPHGRIYRKDFDGTKVDQVTVYDDGYAGYAIETTLPIRAHPVSIDERDRAFLACAEFDESSAPFALFKEACDLAGVPFRETCADFFITWKNSGSWLFPEQGKLEPETIAALKQIQWPETALSNAHFWAVDMIERLKRDVKLAGGIGDALKMSPWKDLLNSQYSEVEEVLSQIHFGVYVLANTLPEPPELFHDPIVNAQLISSYFRVMNLDFERDYVNVYRQQLGITNESMQAVIQTPLTATAKPLKQLKKREENRPVVILQVEDETIALVYDPTAQHLMWPMKNKLFRFQPKTTSFPEKVHLHEASQTNYPGTSQPLSYDCVLHLGDRHEEVKLSMNHVHETWDGWRLYLANISPGTSGKIQNVQLAVNYDPGKYWLTYPGAILLMIGITLLLWFKK